MADQQRTIEILKAATTLFVYEADPAPAVMVRCVHEHLDLEESVMEVQAARTADRTNPIMFPKLTPRAACIERGGCQIV